MRGIQKRDVALKDLTEAKQQQEATWQMTRALKGSSSALKFSGPDTPVGCEISWVNHDRNLE